MFVNVSICHLEEAGVFEADVIRWPRANGRVLDIAQLHWFLTPHHHAVGLRIGQWGMRLNMMKL